MGVSVQLAYGFEHSCSSVAAITDQRAFENGYALLALLEERDDLSEGHGCAFHSWVEYSDVSRCEPCYESSQS